MRVNLNDETAARLVALKEHFGYATVTHLVNLLVKKEYDAMNSAHNNEVSNDNTSDTGNTD